MIKFPGHAKVLSTMKYGVDYKVDQDGSILFHNTNIARCFQTSVNSIAQDFNGTKDTEAGKIALASTLNQFFNFIQWPVRATVKNQTYREAGSVTDRPMTGHLQILFQAME